MKLSAYLSGVLSNFKDSRVIENVTELVQNIIEHKSIRLWSISEDKAEFERSKRLLDGALKSVLDDKKISAAIRDHSVAVDVTGEKLYLGGLAVSSSLMVRAGCSRSCGSRKKCIRTPSAWPNGAR
ncbi:MAG: hypothetical protein L6R45_22715 [Anaerolineae bacterium]|nr:hypothetical protein [Anaerolineae bacterium]